MRYSRHLLCGHPFAACYQCETTYSLLPVINRMADTFLRRQKWIKLRLCLVMTRLGTPFTILTTITTLGVNDGTSIKLIPHKMARHLMRQLIELLFIGHLR